MLGGFGLRPALLRSTIDPIDFFGISNCIANAPLYYGKLLFVASNVKLPPIQSNFRLVWLIGHRKPLGRQVSVQVADQELNLHGHFATWRAGISLAVCYYSAKPQVHRPSGYPLPSHPRNWEGAGREAER